MALKLEDKKLIVTEVAKVVGEASFAIIASYRGLTVAQMTELRSKARQAGVFLRVVRNTLARRAVQDTNFACLQEALVGPMILIFSLKDPGDCARLIRDFAKENKLLEIKALSFGGTLMSAKELEAVANLPTREQAIALLLGVLNAPVVKLARTLAEPYARVARVLSALAEKKQAA
jgi:large subunit ribosomal protein L10